MQLLQHYWLWWHNIWQKRCTASWMSRVGITISDMEHANYYYSLTTPDDFPIMFFQYTTIHVLFLPTTIIFTITIIRCIAFSPRIVRCRLQNHPSCSDDVLADLLHDCLHSKHTLAYTTGSEDQTSWTGVQHPGNKWKEKPATLHNGGDLWHSNSSKNVCVRNQHYLDMPRFFMLDAHFSHSF